MKKMIILVSAICIAAASQAAYVAWNIKALKNSEGTAMSSGHVYVFATAGSTASTDWISALAGAGATEVQNQMGAAAFDYAVASAPTAGDFSYPAVAGAGKGPTNATMGMNGGAAYALYAVIFDTTEITDASKFYVTAVRSATTFEDSSDSTKTWALTATTSGTASNWKSVSDVPEPTSGLLLLVGGALLALRRKQK